MADSAATDATQEAGSEGQAGVEVQDAELAQAEEVAVPAAEGGQIDLLLDMPMPVSVQFGQIEMPVRQLLQLGPGTVVKLDKLVGEPLDLFLRGVRFATGDLVVVGEQIGVRVREVISPPVAAESDQAV